MTRDLDALALDPRVTVRNGKALYLPGSCVLYWMQRSQRAQDNPALDLAVEAGNALGKPVVVFLGPVPFFPNANRRHFAFLAQGVADIAAGLAKKGIGFVFRPFPRHSLEVLCEELRPALVIGDENPLRETERWRVEAARRLAVPLWTVDADAIVPAKLLGREHFAARTIRPRIHERLGEFLVAGKEPWAKFLWRKPYELFSAPADESFLRDFPAPSGPEPVTAIRGGSAEAKKRLRAFLRERLRGYAQLRNKPELSHTSQLSPYLHFGHLGARELALAVKSAEAPLLDRKAFLEEMIVRRELAINFVRYNPRYDTLDCAEPWAKKSIAEHRADARPYLYSARQLEGAQTHDPLWNAAQRQMVDGGWMHGYLRMYWAKKILEWTRNLEEAFEIAVRLNDRYELDGRDPNGYAGIAWAIAGKHDRAWGPVRPIFGKIRYMSFDSTSRKFDWKAYAEHVKSVSLKMAFSHSSRNS